MGHYRICKSIEHEFDIGDRSRGRVYFEEDLVAIEKLGNQGVIAIVTGMEAYEVAIRYAEARQGSVIVSCECPRFADGYNCKHLFATFLEIDRLQLIDHSIPRRVAVIDESPGFVEIGKSIDFDQFSETPATSSNRQATAIIASGWRQLLSRALDTDRLGSKPLSPFDQSRLDSKLPLWFVVDLAQQVSLARFEIGIFEEEQRGQADTEADGSQSQAIGLRPIRLAPYDLDSRCTPDEAKAIKLLSIGEEESDGAWTSNYLESRYHNFLLDSETTRETLLALCQTKRFAWTLNDVHSTEHLHRVKFDKGSPWNFRLLIEPSENGDAKQLVVRPIIERRIGERHETLRFEQVVAACLSGVFFYDDKVALIGPADASFLRSWQQTGQIEIPRSELPQLLTYLINHENHPDFKLDPQLNIQTQQTPPQPIALFSMPAKSTREIYADVSIRYGSIDVSISTPQKMIWDPQTESLIERNFDAEIEFARQLNEIGLTDFSGYDSKGWYFPGQQFGRVVRELLDQGWEVLADSIKQRMASEFSIEVQSGEDWFDLVGGAEFDGTKVGIPELLKALKDGRNYVQLGDGSQGILPEQWLQQLQALSQLGINEEEGLRFRRSQAILLDCLLAEHDSVSQDLSFTKLVKRLRNFDGIKPGKPDRQFHGALRDYQKQGLGWFKFLRDFGFGGCLADEMGLGKTIQVLALLISRVERRLKTNERRKPSIVVVPTSLVFNWVQEAERFTPKLRVVNYTGLDRKEKLDRINKSHLVVTTYGTLRRDIEKLLEIEFDYAIVDEAQAIKNPKSQASKACRLLKADNRLAMTGTPIENHLGDLGALFEFINPGMLSHKLVGSAGSHSPEWLAALNEGIKPFVLRRTKQQVLTELPEKIDQVVYCEMGSKQAKVYKEILEHYRVHLSGKVKDMGWNRSKIHVLEALLRLRQIACDPRLVKDSYRNVGCKIELLLQQLPEVIESGHKALVFSQFTSMLSLVKNELDKAKIPYEYLDGSTRNRQAIVDRFQENDESRVFLISLKAGGSGLNLTAADYVYLLDPWWNPAIESQAIDRAHRIGQTNTVMSYRLITKDTIEEKIMNLQQSKRDLAEAIMMSDGSPLQSLSFDDLTEILS